MSKQSQERSRKAAAYLKDHKVTRDTGMCPWGCGRPIRNGGPDLMTHLSYCKGRRRK